MWLLGLFLRWRGVRVVVLTVHGLLIEDFGTTMLDSRLKFPEITRRIIGCAMAVHSELGNGFQEVVYQRALMVEMEREGLSFSREHEVPIWFKGVQVGTRRVDFFVEEVVLVELKAVSVLEDVHISQVLNYLEAFELEVGLLINFGRRSLDFRRLRNKKV